MDRLADALGIDRAALAEGQEAALVEDLRAVAARAGPMGPGAAGPVLAYCASGNRSSVVWALSQAGQLPVEDLIAIPARHGYQLEHLRPQLETLSRQG